MVLNIVHLMIIFITFLCSSTAGLNDDWDGSELHETHVRSGYRATE